MKMRGKVARKDWDRIAIEAIKRWKYEVDPRRLMVPTSCTYDDGSPPTETKYESIYSLDDFKAQLMDELRDTAATWYEQGKHDMRCDFYSGFSRLLDDGDKINDHN